jgi:hypothetical protein
MAKGLAVVTGRRAASDYRSRKNWPREGTTSWAGVRLDAAGKRRYWRESTTRPS